MALNVVTHNKLPKFAAKSAAGTNTHWALPNNVRICPLVKRYKHMKFFALFLISVLSSSAFAEVVFDGCEPLVCEQLLSQIENGIPIYSGDMDTGGKLNLDASAISKIIQTGGNFQLCAGATTIYKINYNCTANKPCRFVSDGSKSKSRTQFDVCL